MRRKLNLHRAAPQPDWETVPPAQRNPWQRLAARTHGIVTPANIVSMAGALLVLVGFVKIIDNLSLASLGLIAIGRAADIADGAVAELTKTKSPLGEALDATTDKILIFIAFICLWISQLVPMFFLLVLFFHNFFNSIIALYGRKYSKSSVHPTREGKLAVAVSWVLVLLFLLKDWLKSPPNQHFPYGIQATDIVIYILFIAYALLIFVSSRDYILQLRNTRVGK